MKLRTTLLLSLSLLQPNFLIANATAQTEQSKSDDQRRGEGGKGGGEAGKGGGGKGGGGGGKAGGSGLGNYTVPPPANNVPEHLYNIILGRPTDLGITIRALFHKDATAFVAYGNESGKLTEKTSAAKFKAKGTHDFVLNSLKPNSRYYYKLVYQGASGESEFAKNRPGWEAPIHDLLVKHGATIVFAKEA